MTKHVGELRTLSGNGISIERIVVDLPPEEDARNFDGDLTFLYEGQEVTLPICGRSFVHNHLRFRVPEVSSG